MLKDQEPEIAGDTSKSVHLLRAFLLAVGLVVVAFLVPSYAQMPPTGKPSFTGQRGLGVVQPFLFPRKHPSKPELYDFDPYTPRWTRVMVPSRMDEIRRAGFDFLRVAVDPGPLMEAEGDLFQERLSDIKIAVDSTLGAGLKIVLDIHVSESHSLWGFRSVTSGFTTHPFERYLAVLEALARMLKSYDSSRVALEVFNEPPPPCTWKDKLNWNDQVQLIYRRARTIAPNLTLLISGPCWASIDGLLELDGSRFDSDVLFVFHFYEPRIFTHQGFWGSEKYLKYLPRISFPPVPSQVEAELRRVTESIGRATDIAENEREVQKDRATRYMREYFNTNPIEHINGRFAKVRQWASRYRIEPNRIVLGEFGAMKDVWSFKGADPLDRARWLAVTRRTAESHRFRWIIWAMTNTMGIVTGDIDGPLDPSVLHALGLETP